MNEPLYLIPILVALGVGAQWIAARFRLPAIILLLAVGIALRPLLGLFQQVPSPVEQSWLKAFVSLAVGVVLFEGGMSLNIAEARHVGPTLRRLLLSGVVIGFGLVTLAARLVADLSWATSSMLGAVLVVTGPTVIIPMLRHARIALRPATLLKWEGIVSDPIGALLAYFVFAVATMSVEQAEGMGFMGFLLTFVSTTIGAGLIGGTVGYLLARALNRGAIAEHVKTSVILAAVLVVFVTAEALGHESGLLAVTVMGVVLGNTDNHSIEDIRRFKEQISTVLVSTLFIVLSAQLRPSDLEQLIGIQMVLIGLILFVIRPLVGLAATLHTDLPWGERVIVGWIAPRGVVAAAVAGAFAPQLQAYGYDDARALVPIVFGVILATVVLHGLSLQPLARALGLAARAGNGILIVGASRWVLSLAQALAKAGANVILADARYRRVSRARMEGLEVHHGDVLAGEAAMQLPMEQVSWVFAAADDDSYNALVCLAFAPELGREAVLQVTPSVTEKRSEEVVSHMRGRNPWGEHANYHAIASRFWRGTSFKTTQLTAEFGWPQLKEIHSEALFMFYVYQDRLQVLESSSIPPIGSQVIYLS